MLRFVAAHKAIRASRTASVSAASIDGVNSKVRSSAERLFATRGSLVAPAHLAAPAMANAEESSSYQSALQVTFPLPGASWGAEVRGIDLRKDPSPATLQDILANLTRHRLLVFREQGVIEGARQVEIATWLGRLESTFSKHPRSPHPDVFRVANDRAEGCTGIGRTGWHIDGSFQEKPFAYSVYHIVSVPSAGATVFAPLTEVLAALPAQTRDRWEGLTMVSSGGRVAHPVVYAHPLTGLPTMCFHTGMTEAFIEESGDGQRRRLSKTETLNTLDEIEATFQDGGAGSHLRWHHQWRQGDFIIADNLAVGHEASADTQRPPADVGLRIMHRCTVAGSTTPTKLPAS